MWRESGEAVLIDFGLSRHDKLPDLLAEGFRFPWHGALHFARTGARRPQRPPQRHFSLGVMLYFFATGHRPFGNPESRRGLRKRLYRDAKPPHRIRRDFPVWLQEIILRCLEVDPDRRHDTAAQVAFDLTHPDEVMRRHPRRPTRARGTTISVCPKVPVSRRVRRPCR